VKCSAPVIHLYPGYDPASPTLVGPELTAGNCLPDLGVPGRSWVWSDRAAPLRAGCIVFFGQRDPATGEVQHLAKQLEKARGRWWGCSPTEGCLLIDLGLTVYVRAMVARVEFDWDLVAGREQDPPMDRQLWRSILRASRPALAEWAAQGLGPRVRCNPRDILAAQTKTGAVGARSRARW
jgi:hypothetical protein